jgi:hypothetical protein
VAKLKKASTRLSEMFPIFDAWRSPPDFRKGPFLGFMGLTGVVRSETVAACRDEYLNRPG